MNALSTWQIACLHYRQHNPAKATHQKLQSSPGPGFQASQKPMLYLTSNKDGPTISAL